MLAGHDVANREIGPNEDRAVTEPREDAPCFGEREGIDVETEKPAGWRGAFEDGLGVATRSHRAVEEAATFAGIKLGEYLGQENRLMKPPIVKSRDSRGRPRSRFGLA